MNTISKSIVGAVVLAFGLVNRYSPGAEPTNDSPPAFSREGANDRVRLASGDEVGVAALSHNLRAVCVSGEPVRRLGASEVVWSLVVNRERTACILHLAQWTRPNGGWWHSRLVLLIDRSHSASGSLEVADVLVWNDLEEGKDSRCSILDVGSIDHFPLVDLYVSMETNRSGVWHSDRQWQQWDVSNERLVGRVEANTAEARAIAVKDRGDMIGTVPRHSD